MKEMMKIGAAALAVAAFVPAFAQEVAAVDQAVEAEEPVAVVAAAEAETETEGETEGECVYESVGWTPLALGIATPIQLPWGWRKWDVFGLDLNLIYSDTPTMYGLDIGLLALQTREESAGAFFSIAFNGARKDVKGLRATIGVNYCGGTVRGVELDGIGLRESIYGVDLNIVGAVQKNMCGVEISTLGNFSSVESYGVTLAGVCNMARSAYGLQMSILFNQTEALNGCQVALVNFADECVSGFQIGLINIILSNQVKVLPFVNGYF